MAKINFDVPEAKHPRVVAAMKGVYSIPEVNKGTVEEPDMQPKFSDEDWAAECVRQFILRTVQRYEQAQAIQAAKAGVSKDDDIAKINKGQAKKL